MQKNLDVFDLLAALEKVFRRAIARAGEKMVVLTRDRAAGDTEAYARLFIGLDKENLDPLPKGVMIRRVNLRQRRGESTCFVRQTHYMQFDFLYPYNDKEGDAETSEVKFQRMIDLFAAELNRNENQTLGITDDDFQGADVWHNLLQGDASQFTLQNFGEGTDALFCHFAPLTLEVLVTINTDWIPKE